MLKVAFICVHNSCRSQMAEALGRKFAGDVFESFSAGIKVKEEINQDAVRVIQQLHGIDMNATQYPKLLSELPDIDLVITMGCIVGCPHIPHRYQEDWGIEDPTGKGDDVFITTAYLIESKVKQLRQRILKNQLNLT